MADIVKAQPNALQTMKTVIEKYSTQIQQLIPKHVTGERIVNIALTALTRNPKLVECDPRTVLAGIIQASILGLELHSPLHHASLVPFWNSKARINEALLMIEYPGLIELVMRGGETSFVESQPVYQNDEIDIVYGDNPHLVHRPQIRTARGKLIGAYAYAKLKDGSTKFHYMTSEDIEKRRAVSKAKDAGPWVNWEEEQYAKTPLRHLCKQLRKTAETSVALDHENRMDMGTSSIVENCDGLSMDFLSMNIEAKTIDSQSNLRQRLADKTQPPAEQQQPPDNPPPGNDGTPTDPPPTPTTQPKPNGIEETRRRLAEAKAKEDAQKKAEVVTEPEPEITNDDLPEFPSDEMAPDGRPIENVHTDGLMGQWDKEAESFPPTMPQASKAQKEKATPKEKAASPTQTKAPTDPLDEKISGEEKNAILVSIQSNKIAPVQVRAFMDSLTPKVALLTNVTKRQLPEFKQWIEEMIQSKAEFQAEAAGVEKK